MKITESAALPFRQGSTVHVLLHDARVIEANVILVSRTVSGIKARVLSGSLLMTIDPEQVIKVLKY